jgi:hypothetical protein
LIKTVPGDGKKSTVERELAIQQIVKRPISNSTSEEFDKQLR